MTDTDAVLHTDDPDRPGNLTAEEYRAELEAYAKAHPKKKLDPSLYTEYTDDELAE